MPLVLIQINLKTDNAGAQKATPPVIKFKSPMHIDIYGH